MDNKSSGSSSFFGIIGLVGAILSLLFSVIPCVGLYAIIPSLISVVFCLIPFLYEKENKGNRKAPIFGMIIGVITILIGIFQYYTFKVIHDVKTEIENEFMESIEESIQNELGNDSIQKSERDSIYP